MGSQTILDLIGSTVVFGALLLITLQLNTSNSENMQTYRGDLLVQQNLVEVTKLIEYDFRKIGYCKDPSKIPDPSKAIVSADSTSIAFLTDIATSSDPAGDGVVDTLHYYLGSTSELDVTPNPNDRMLYRVLNSDPPKGANLGVVTFRLLYFNALNDTIAFPVSNPGEIVTMQITVQVENLAASTIAENVGQAQYSSAFWRQVRLASRNLKNR